MTVTKLFSEFTIRDVRLKNRAIVAPMWQYEGVDGRPTDWHLMHLGRLAHGGAGLVFQEGTAVEERGRGTTGDLGIWNDECIPYFARLVTMMRSAGAVPGIQIMHAGRKVRQKMPSEGRGRLPPDASDPDWAPIAPSPIAESDQYPVPREMRTDDIERVADAFVAAARRAHLAGYEVLNLHAGHGYLLHSFLSPITNRRSDGYGGSWNRRVRLLLDVVEGIRAVWPASKALFVRLSCIDGPPDGWSLEDSIKLAPLLHVRGVDVIDCSSGGIVGLPLPPGQTASYGYQVKYASAIRHATGVPTAAVGLIVHAAQAEEILVRGDADLVMLARELIYNPNWPIDAAQKLGENKGFGVVARRKTSFPLESRAANVPGLQPSTFDIRET